MNYHVEVGQAGRGGTITYVEDGQRLNFDWEFSTAGADIMVPTPEQWDAYWEQSGAAWAKGRRQEILERVAQETRQQQAQTATVSIEDRWIVMKF